MSKKMRLSLDKLSYDIHSYSSYSAAYHPRNILTNNPLDQSSRWSSNSNNQAQFLMLKMPNLAIVQTITFGKYHKVHVCNLKEFKVFGGQSPNCMFELLHAGLKNDTESETFTLKHKTDHVAFPIQYIKIVPLLAHGANFNFSIWYVELKGVSNQDTVQAHYQQFMQVSQISFLLSKYREEEVLRLCLKHFRQRNYMDIFNALQQTTKLGLEDPLLTELHAELVSNGNFDRTETLMSQAAHKNLFEEYISECVYKPKWKKIVSTDLAGESPCMRGGHQMAVDSDTGRIYLLGGWDGTKDLGDFWVYDTRQDQWRCISKDTAKQGGPGARSCHKICFDPVGKQLFVLGRYVDIDSRPNFNLDSEFWKFDLQSERWWKVSSNTAADGGPELIYDHQMVIDTATQTIYTFGGRVIHPESTVHAHSGLYSYHIPTNSWKLIRGDADQADNAVQMKSRIGHSMLLNPISRELYIFAGQRSKDYLSDFYIYELDTDNLHEVTKDYSKSGGPDAGFTQRATFNKNYQEIFVLSGLMRDKNSSNESVKNSFWMFNVQKQKWTRIYQNENTGVEYWDKMKDLEPCPRFAHQLVYDPKTEKLYLFGGNPGSISNPNLRLDDFWELTLERPTVSDVLRRSIFDIRMQKFKEFCLSGKTNVALAYLRSDISPVVNHQDEIESKEFRDLTKSLFFLKNNPAMGRTDVSKEIHSLRVELHEKLIKFFPSSCKEPSNSLIDLLPII